ncbi:hypothetical protein HFD88_001620 [Aspergillus terreus]|nr:hypothetical protein HFD88_001620 [Aspergillus terreus]
MAPEPRSNPQVPLLIYGTAWKEERTGKLSQEALENGFTGLDTANYPTAYNEPLTGDSIEASLKTGIKREHLFIQSKFTPLWAHDKDKIPFDPHQSIEGQIRESVQQSLAHLKVDYLDAFLLHAPYEDENDNLVAWRVLETFVPHQIRCLGVSNFSLPQLRKVFESSIAKPVIVQNRFFQDTGYDTELRAFCADHGILYQAFWMLKANSEILESDLLSSVAEKLGVEKELAFYILILGLGGTCILDGTTKSERMVRDLQTVAEVFGNGQLRPDLQGSVRELRQLLWKLASRKTPA